MTNFQCMNDETELKYGINLGIETFIRLCKSEELKFNGGFFEKILNYLKDQSISPILKSFIFCFCENEEYDFLWEKYANNHKGFCIEFNLDNLLSIKYPIALYKVIYDRKKQVNLFTRAFCKLQEFALENNLQSSAENIGDKSKLNEFLMCFFKIFFMLSIKFKSEKWSKENEWRLIKLIPKDDFSNFFYQASEHNPREYIKHEIILSNSNSSIQSIRFGKNLIENPTKNCLESLIAKLHLKIPVYKSIL